MNPVPPPSSSGWQLPQQQFRPVSFVAPDTINEHTPPEVANAIVRRQAKRAQAWATVAGVTAALAALLTWLSFYTPGGVTMLAAISGLVVGAVELLYLLWAISLLVIIVRLLMKLRDRAVYYRPQLARSATDIHAMHLWPVRNMFGPVQALIETGVPAARGVARLFWPVGYVAWIVGLVWLWLADASLARFQALIVLSVASGCLALSANLLQRLLAPEEARRVVPLGSASSADEAFWSKGIIDVAPKRGPRVVDVPIDDGIDQYYRRED